MADEHDTDDTHQEPPLADLSERPTPTPGPLTKPSPTQSDGRRRGPLRALIIVLAVVLLLLIISGIIWWSMQGGDADSSALTTVVNAITMLS